MNFRVTRYGIDVFPEDETDRAYIEDTLGLKREGDALPLVRKNDFDANSLHKLTTHPYPNKEYRWVQIEKMGSVDPTTPEECSAKVSELLEWFEYKHLPDKLQDVSKATAVLAHAIAGAIGDDPELDAGLRKLLEAKDCFVRAAIRQSRER